MGFKPNRKFRVRYNRIFKKNPLGANVFLLIAELTTGTGRVKTTEAELAALFSARFGDPSEYALEVSNE